MTANLKIILPALLALLLGIGIGYFIFNKPIPPHSGNGDHSMMEKNAPTANEKETIFTCSMHPQIRQNEPGDCAICGMDLIPLVENTSSDPLVLEMTEDAVKLANIQTSKVGNSTEQAKRTLRLSGKVQADERMAASLVAHVPGRIEKLFVTFTGEHVSKGQPLATLYSPELISAQRELLEALKLQDLNPALVKAARNKLRFWKIGENTIETIEQNGVIQETFTLYAEAAGVVMKRRVAVGDYLQQGEPLFDLMNLSKVWVLFDAYEEDLSNISIGDRLEFTASALGQTIFKTRVTFIDPIIDPDTRIAAIRTEVNNSQGTLKPEMLVTGILQKKSNNNSALSVPKSAVLWTGTRSVVYVKIPDLAIPSFQFREVALGDALGNSYQVLSGLEEGEEVVTYGSFTIDAAAQLNNQASMMNREVKVKNVAQIKSIPDYTAATPLRFQQQLMQVAEAYLLLKDALVATDHPQATSIAQQLLQAITAVDKTLLKAPEALQFWTLQTQALQNHGQQIAAESEIASQRQQFHFLSQSLINTIKAFGLPAGTLYVQHCPMVNDNQGADWLSKETDIRNPYFGDQMLTCGAVKATLSTESSH